MLGLSLLGALSCDIHKSPLTPSSLRKTRLQVQLCSLVAVIFCICLSVCPSSFQGVSLPCDLNSLMGLRSSAFSFFFFLCEVGSWEWWVPSFLQVRQEPWSQCYWFLRVNFISCYLMEFFYCLDCFIFDFLAFSRYAVLWCANRHSFFFFLVAPCSMQGLSSPTRDVTHPPCCGSLGS